MIKIRNYKRGDFNEICKLFYNTVHAVCKKDYNEKQLNVWAPLDKDYGGWKDKFEKTKTFVAEYNDKIVGFANVDKNGYLDMFYVHKDFLGKGIGRKLYASILQYVKSMGMKFMYSDVSITAKRFFLNQDFKVIKEQEIKRDGVILKNYRMKLILDKQYDR